MKEPICPELGNLAGLDIIIELCVGDHKRISPLVLVGLEILDHQGPDNLKVPGRRGIELPTHGSMWPQVKKRFIVDLQRAGDRSVVWK